MPDPITLDQVDARVAATTPGPWRPQWSRGWVVMHGYDRLVVIGCRPEDADLIAHAPTDLASMSAELRELRQQKENANLILDETRRQGNGEPCCVGRHRCSYHEGWHDALDALEEGS